MAAIFINYRRKDTEKTALALFQFFARHYGEHNVFLDTESVLEMSKPFPDQLEEKVKACQVFICLIGKRWAKSFIENKSEDWVLQELLIAIRNNKKIIPILTDGLKKCPENIPVELLDFDFRQLPWIILRNNESLEKPLSKILEEIDLPRINIHKNIFDSIRSKSEEKFNDWKEDFVSRFPDGILKEMIPTANVYGEDNTKPIYEHLDLFRQLKRRHIILLGKGGSGKSVAMADVWNYSHCKVVMKKMCVFSGNPKTVENLV